MDAIRAMFDQWVVQTDADWRCFSAKLVHQEVPKKTCLLKAGQTERFLSFIETGIVRYYVAGNENDTTFAFSFGGEAASAYDSFLTQKPAAYNVETLIPASLWRISYDDLQEIYRDTQAGDRIGRMAAESLFIKKSRREFSLLRDGAEDRYMDLMQDSRELLRHIPLKYLASYIGVTPQALSRIRARIS